MMADKYGCHIVPAPVTQIPRHDCNARGNQMVALARESEKERAFQAPQTNSEIVA